MTNSERRISRARAAVKAHGEARHDWQIATQFALSLGRKLDRDATALFPYRNPEQVFEEHRESTMRG